jgi:hypothetical protein
LLQRVLEAWGLHFRKGDDADRTFYICDGGVSNRFPVAGACAGERALEVAHDLVRLWRLGPRAKQRVDELRERVPRRARGRLSVVLQQQPVDVRQLICLLGRQGARGWPGIGFEHGKKLWHCFVGCASGME